MLLLREAQVPGFFASKQNNCAGTRRNRRTWEAIGILREDSKMQNKAIFVLLAALLMLAVLFMLVVNAGA